MPLIPVKERLASVNVCFPVLTSTLASRNVLYLGTSDPLARWCVEGLVCMSDKERAQLFRDRAAELRQIAPTMKDEAAATQLLRMALMYDTLAIKLDGGANDDGSFIPLPTPPEP